MKRYIYLLIILIFSTHLNATQLLSNDFIKEYQNGDIELTMFAGIHNTHSKPNLYPKKRYKKENIEKIFDKKSKQLKEIKFFIKERELNGTKTIFWTTKLIFKENSYEFHGYNYDKLRRILTYKDGKHIKDQDFYDGKLVGETTFKWDNKELKLATGRYEGKIAKIVPFKHGKVDGTVKEYDSNGDLKQISHYKNGKLHGKETEYRSGKLAAERFIENGLLVGVETWYHENGAVFSRQDFKSGKIEHFDKKGNLIKY